MTRPLDATPFIDQAARRFHVTFASIRGRRRTARIARARQFAIRLALDAGHGPSAVARMFLRDRATIIHASTRL